MGITIAISGLPGSGSTTTSKALAKKIGYDHFSVGRVFKDIANGSVKDKFYYPMFKELCDKVGLVIPSFESDDDSSGTLNLWNSDFGKSAKLHKAMDDLQIKLAEKGNIVLDGKLALHFIPKADLKVWLTANDNERAFRSAKRDGIGAEDALKIILSREKREREEWMGMYGVDYLMQREKADIVIETSNLVPDEIVEKMLSSEVLANRNL